MIIDGTGPTAAGTPTFDGFYASNAPRTVALAFALTGNWSDAEDLAQDAFGAAHRRWAEVSDYDDPAAWVRRLILNRAVSRWRRLQRESAALVRLRARAGEALAAQEPVDRAFWSAVRGLPAAQARAVALFYVEDMSVDQIAGQLGCSSGSVKTHLSRARATLAGRLGMEDQGHE